MKKIDKTLLIIIITSLMQFVASYNINLTTVALPYIGSDLGMSIITQNNLNLVIMMCTAALGLPLANFLIKKGIKKSAIKCCILSIILLIISFLALDQYTLLISRFLQGPMMGTLYILGPVIISLSIPKNKLGYALGILGSSGYIGLSLAPTLTGLIINYISWRYIFLTPIIFLLIIIILLLKNNMEYDVKQDPTDIYGSLLWIISTLLLIYGLSCYDIILVVLSIILYIAFYLQEKRTEYPLFNVNLFKNKRFTFANINAMIMCIVTYSVSLVISYYLTYIKLMDPVIVGILLFITPICQIFISPISGKLSDKIHPTKISPIGFTVIIITMIIFTFINELPIIFLIIGLILQSVGYALFVPSNGKFIITSVPKENLNEVNSLYSNLRNIGNSLSTAIVNIIFIIIIGKISNASEITLLLSIKIIFIIFTIFGIIGLLLTLFNKKNINHQN